MKDELIYRLREQIQLHSECTDEELLDAFEGSFTLEHLKLKMAFEDLGREIAKIFEPLLKLMRGK